MGSQSEKSVSTGRLSVAWLAILLAGSDEDLLRLSGQSVGCAVQGIVKGLRHFEEVITPCDHVPMRAYFQFGQERDEPVKDFGDSSAHRG